MEPPQHDVPVRVDHVGIAVHSVEAAEPVLSALGCIRHSDEAVTSDGSVPYDEADQDARFRWTYYRIGDASRVELIEPIAADTFLTDFLDRHGPGFHHVTLEVGDLDRLVEHLEAAGVTVVDRQAYEGWTEAFVSPRNPTGALFQLMEYHDDDADDGCSPETLFVNGRPVQETVDR